MLLIFDTLHTIHDFVGINGAAWCDWVTLQALLVNDTFTTYRVSDPLGRDRGAVDAGLGRLRCPGPSTFGKADAC